MKVLVADDDPVSRRLLEKALGELAHEVTVVHDGREAWDALCETRYDMVISDWVMPGIEGPDLCKRLRSRQGEPFCFVMLITARDTTDDVVEGIMAGANDFMTKPWQPAELKARICAAARTVAVERALARKVVDLQRALDEVAMLREILPICVYCKSIRSDDRAWDKIDEYLQREGVAEFSHGICPSCYTDEVEPLLDELHGPRRQTG